MPAAELRGAGAAATFLTRLPLARRTAFEAADLARGAPWFPLVGAGIGAAGGGTAYGLAQLVPPLVAGGAAVGVIAVLTGGLHLDGLADTADSLGARTRDAALAIMRDHAVGAFGTTAVAVDVLVKAAALASLAPRGRVVLFALAAGALSRSGAAALAAVLPSARADGAGAAFRPGRMRALAAGAAAAGIAFVLRPRDALVLALVAVGLVVVAGLWFRRRYGGVTGDALGAAVEVAETVLLAVAAGLA